MLCVAVAPRIADNYNIRSSSKSASLLSFPVIILIISAKKHIITPIRKNNIHSKNIINMIPTNPSITSPHAYLPSFATTVSAPVVVTQPCSILASASFISISS